MTFGPKSTPARCDCSTCGRHSVECPLPPRPGPALAPQLQCTKSEGESPQEQLFTSSISIKKVVVSVVGGGCIVVLIAKGRVAEVVRAGGRVLAANVRQLIHRASAQTFPQAAQSPKPQSFPLRCTGAGWEQAQQEAAKNGKTLPGASCGCLGFGRVTLILCRKPLHQHLLQS